MARRTTFSAPFRDWGRTGLEIVLPSEGSTDSEDLEDLEDLEDSGVWMHREG